jgi:hypothetical protein
MDVSTDILSDDRVRKLFRSPVGAVAFVAYVAVLGESWRMARRVPLDDAWPAVVPFDADAARALTRVGLLDRRGQIPAKSWQEWFKTASERRTKARERWNRYNRERPNREGNTALVPRGNDVVTASSVPPVPFVRSTSGVNGVPARARPNSVDRDPLLRQIRETYQARDNDEG